MKKTVKKNLLLSSLLCAGILASSCDNKMIEGKIIYPNIDNTNDYSINNEYEPSTIEITNDVNEDYDSLDFNTDDLNIIKTNNKTPIYNYDKEIIGYFTPEHDFMYLDEDSTNYLINYYGNNGYVNKKDTYQSTKKIINTEMIDKG